MGNNIFPSSARARAGRALLQLTVFNRDPVTHTIPLEFLDADLEVGIPDSDDILVGDFLELYVRGTPLGTRRTVTVADKQAAQGNPAFYYSMTIDKASFPSEGESVTFNVDYYVGSGSVKDLSNLPVEVILDREPPGGTPLPYLSFTPEQLDGIAQSDLTDDYLEVRAPLWYGKRIGDVLTPWLGTSETEGVLITESEVEVTSIGETTFARFPKSLLLINGDVPQYFAYQLRDGLGNQSEVARSREIPVSLTRWRYKSKKRFEKSGRASVDNGVGKLVATLLPPLQVPDTVFPDGTLPLAILGADLPVRIPNKVPEFPAGAVIQLYRVAEDGTATELGPQRPITQAESDDGSFVFDLAIPKTDFPATGTTPWALDYSVFDPLSSGEGLSGNLVTVIFDREAPGGASPPDMPLLEFTQEQLSGITLADVVGDGIPVSLPAWYLSAGLDVAQLWLSDTAAEDDAKYLPGTFTLTDASAGKALDVEFLVTDIEPLGNKVLYFAYRLTDKAGNISPRSNPVAIEVLLTEAPTDLEPPVVPDNEAHGVVTQQDAAELVEVEIPNYTNAAEGDRIYVVWGNTKMPPVTLVAADLNPAPPAFLKVIKLPYADVLAEGSGNGKLVTYEVWRGSVLANTSPSTSVNVNLDSPGPGPDPDPGTPWHENLVPLVVVGDSGAGGDNVIPPGDFNKDAVATVPHIGKDGMVIWKPGDRVQVSWDGILIGTPFPITLANEKQDAKITIPAVTVGASTGLKDVFYIVSRDLPPSNQVATAVSEPTPVDVQSPGLLPGDGSLAKAIFPEEDTVQNVINRVNGLDGTPIQIMLKGVSNIAKDDLINLRFVGREGLVDPTAPEISGTELVVIDHKITDQEIALGYYELAVPYNPYLQKICRAGCTVNYSITNKVGTPVEADQKYIRIALGPVGDLFVCPINPTIPADSRSRTVVIPRA